VPSIAVVKDEPIESLVRNEAGHILAVTADATNTSQYQIFLSDFPRADILGMSIGQRRIYISYKLGRRALHNRHHLWVLRQTLAHEIAHEIARHADYLQMNFNRSSNEYGMSSRDVGLPWYVIFQPYSLEKELQADLDGMQYWRTSNGKIIPAIRIIRLTPVYTRHPPPAAQPKLIVTFRCKLIRTAGMVLSESWIRSFYLVDY
jgi:predicted Zn-dependent protease